jgi:hypothetical protein
MSFCERKSTDTFHVEHKNFRAHYVSVLAF